MQTEPSSNTPLDDLIWLARELGSVQRGLVILNEGNVSARLDDKRFLVKSSGACMGELTKADVTECITSEMVRVLEMPMLDTGALERMIRDAQVDRNSRGASQESPFHAWLLNLPGVNFVAHCHPEAILQIACSQAAERFAEHRMFPDEVDFLGAQTVYVPYADSGTPLAREIRSKVQLAQRRAQSRTPKLILLQNHGVIALGSTARATLGTMLMAEKAARVFIGASRIGGPLFLPPQYVARLEGRSEEGPRASTIKL